MKSVVFAVVGLAVFAAGMALADDKAEKKETKGWLGVKLRAEEGNPEIVIDEVLPDSPAQKGGLKADDVVLKLDKEDLKDVRDFVMKIGAKKPGDEVTIRVKRDGMEKDVKVKLGDFPKDLKDK